MARSSYSTSVLAGNGYCAPTVQTPFWQVLGALHTQASLHAAPGAHLGCKHGTSGWSKMRWAAAFMHWQGKQLVTVGNRLGTAEERSLALHYHQLFIITNIQLSLLERILAPCRSHRRTQKAWSPLGRCTARCQSRRPKSWPPRTRGAAASGTLCSPSAGPWNAMISFFHTCRAGNTSGPQPWAAAALLVFAISAAY